MQTTAMGKEAKIKTETRAGPAVAQDDSVGLAAFAAASVECKARCPESEPGSKATILNSCYHFGIILIQGQEADRSTEAVFACALAEGGRPGLAGWARSWAAPWRFWVKTTPWRAGVSASNLGRWLAISTGRLRSLNPCGVRARDECSKRSGRSGWTIGHTICLALALKKTNRLRAWASEPPGGVRYFLT